MIPVHQTRSGEHGNCFEACLASLLELSIVDVPDDLSGWGKIRAWLDRHGYSLHFQHADGEPLNMQANPPAGDAIAGLRLSDGSMHSVLCRDGQIVHDPAVRVLTNQNCPVLLWTILRKK